MDKVYKLMSQCIYRLLSTRTMSAFPSALHSPFRCFCPTASNKWVLPSCWSIFGPRGEWKEISSSWVWCDANNQWQSIPCTVSKLTCFACSTTILDKEKFGGRKHFSPAPKHRGGWYQLPNHAGSPALQPARNSFTTATKQRRSCSCVTFL